MTDELTLAAWTIVLLYKHRWDIEKVFDELKTKLEENRSWASSNEAKEAHALFENLTHNLMLLMENHLHKVEGMKDKVEPKKKIIREKTKNRGWRKKITNFLHKWFLRDSLTEDVSFYSLAEVQLVSSSYLQRFSGRISRRMGVQNPVILDTHAEKSLHKL